MLIKKQQEILSLLEKWFADHKKTAIAFSGGVDSSLLFFIGSRVLGPNCLGLFANSPLMAERQLHGADEFAQKFGLPFKVVNFDPFTQAHFIENTPERCYVCKRALYDQLQKSLEDGWHLVDGTNLDDLDSDRPGFRAITELGISTPYLDCRIEKRQIRALSRALGLPTWDRPSDSCLATRIFHGTLINKDALQRVAQAELILRELGFEGTRAYPLHDKILLTFKEGDIERAIMPEVRKNIQKKMAECSFSKVFLDLSERPGILA